MYCQVTLVPVNVKAVAALFDLTDREADPPLAPA